MSKQAVQLQKLEQLANAGRVSRFLHHPARYMYAMSLIHLFYPMTHKGTLKKASLFFGGNMDVLLPAATDIYLTGGKTHDSEIRLAKYLIGNLELGNHFLDVGAHFGYFSLLASSIVGEKGRVVSVEPAKGTFEVLSRNIINKNNIKALHRAVSGTPGTVSFYEFPVLYSEYNALNIEKFQQEAWIQKNPPVKTEVQAITIDELLAAEQIQPAIIKIDVEGAEVQALSGGTKTWEEGKCTVIMEYLDEGEATSYTAAADILYSHDYRSYMIGNDGELVETTDILSRMRDEGMLSENIVFKKG